LFAEGGFFTTLKGIPNMNKERFRSTLLPLLVISVGGILALGICYLVYVFIYNFIEVQFFPSEPTSVPAFFIRRVLALAFLVLYVVIYRAKISDIVKATILVGPLGFLISTAILSFYEKQMWAIAVTVVIAAFSAFMVYKSKKPWFYYFAIGITVLISVLLVWPQA